MKANQVAGKVVIGLSVVAFSAVLADTSGPCRETSGSLHTFFSCRSSHSFRRFSFFWRQRIGGELCAARAR
jgi:hypothetical protein